MSMSMVSDKPVVKYRTTPMTMIVVGERVFVAALNHQSYLIEQGDVVATSTVLSYDAATGRFETRYSIYELADD